MTSPPGIFRVGRPSLSCSFVVCAYRLDRIESAAEAVLSALAQSCPPHEVIVVVDCITGLKMQLERRLPPEVRIVENRAQRGLSEARNTGVSLSRGEVIAFLDDDAVAGSDWVEVLLPAFTDPKVMVAGGRAIPVWLDRGKRPSWLPEELDWLVGCTYDGFADTVKFVRNVHGSNMCFRRIVFDLVGGFNPSLGGVVFGDDTEICVRIVARPEGYRVLYDPRAVVFHKVPRDRQTMRHCLRHAFEEGVGKEIIRSIHRSSIDALSSEREYLRQILLGFMPNRLMNLIKFRFRDGLQMVSMVCVMASVAAGHLWYWAASRLFHGDLSYRGQSLREVRLATGGRPPA